MQSFSAAPSLQAWLPDRHRQPEPAARVGGEAVGSSGAGGWKGESCECLEILLPSPRRVMQREGWLSVPPCLLPALGASAAAGSGEGQGGCGFRGTRTHRISR